MEIAMFTVFLKSTTTKNPAKFKHNYDLQANTGCQLLFYSIILNIDIHSTEPKKQDLCDGAKWFNCCYINRVVRMICSFWESNFPGINITLTDILQIFVQTVYRSIEPFSASQKSKLRLWMSIKYKRSRINCLPFNKASVLRYRF